MEGSHLQNRLATLLTEARAADLELFDDRDGSTILERVVPEFSELLHRGRSLLGEIEHTCSSTAVPIDAWAFPERAPELEDLCFFVDGEWKRSLDGLERLTASTPGWNCLVQVECARDRLVRGLTAVERELADIAGAESRTSHVDLLCEALQVRRVLTVFRREIDAASTSSDPAAFNLARSLHRAGSALSRLIDREEFARLRAADRHLARDLLDRIRDQLDGSGSRGSREWEGDGVGLWQDVVNFAALLWDVNRRDELVREDLTVIGEAEKELERCAPAEPAPSAVKKRLRALFGRDDRLDEILAADASAARVLDRLRAVRESLARERVPQMG